MAKAAWTSNRAVPTMALKDFPSSQKRKVAFRLDHQEEEHPGPTTPLKLPLRGIFDIGSKHYDVTLEKDRISWSLIQPARHDGESSGLNGIIVGGLISVIKKKILRRRQVVYTRLCK